MVACRHNVVPVSVTATLIVNFSGFISVCIRACRSEYINVILQAPDRAAECPRFLHESYKCRIYSTEAECICILVCSGDCRRHFAWIRWKGRYEYRFAGLCFCRNLFNLCNLDEEVARLVVNLVDIIVDRVPVVCSFVRAYKLLI